jgi:hypothetical protein
MQSNRGTGKLQARFALDQKQSRSKTRKSAALKIL